VTDQRELEQLVRAFYEARNGRDIDAMLAFWHRSRGALSQTFSRLPISFHTKAQTQTIFRMDCCFAGLHTLFDCGLNARTWRRCRSSSRLSSWRLRRANAVETRSKEALLQHRRSADL
jgi:hypothetical protein